MLDSILVILFMLLFYGIPIAVIAIPIAMIVGIIRNMSKINSNPEMGAEEKRVLIRNARIEGAVLIAIVVGLIWLFTALNGDFNFM